MDQHHNLNNDRNSYPHWLTSFLKSLDRFRVPLLLALLAILLAAFNGLWQVEPDSALYLSLARNIARGRGYTFHGETHHLVYPGLPSALAAVFRLFPGREIFFCDLFILGSCFVSLGLVYRLFSLSVGRPTALVITLLTGLAHESFRYTYEIMPEIPFLAAGMAVLAGYEAIYRREESPSWFDWGLLIFGTFIAVHLKPLMLPLVGASIVAMPWRSGRPILLRRCAIGAAIMLAALGLFFLLDPRHPFAAASRSSYEQLAYREMSRFPTRWHTILARNLNDLMGQSITRLVIGVPFNVKALDIIFGIIFLTSAITLIRFRLVWGLWIAVVIAKLTFLYSHDRYLLPILPLMMFAWWKVIVWVCSNFPAVPAKFLFGILLACTIIPSMVKAISIIVDQHRHPFLEHYHGGRAVALQQIGLQLAQIARPGDVILAPAGTSCVITFFSDRNVYEPIIMPELRGRTLAVMPVDVPDAEFIQWLAQMKIKPAQTPLFKCVRPIRQGGTFAIFEVQRR